MEVKADIDKSRMEIENKIDKLDARFRTYFLILLFTIITMNPKSIEMISRLLSVLR